VGAPLAPLGQAVTVNTYGENFRRRIDEAIAHLNDAGEALSHDDADVMAIRVAEAEALCAAILTSYGRFAREVLETLSQERERSS
jgi:hypothetical protein